MASEDPTFSESWYRIADQKICLRPGIRVRRQYFRGERWIVLENPLNNQFFRIHPAAYEFIARLRPDRTVHEVWEECMEKLPDETPGQEAALRLLSQLYQSNLLQYPQATDSAKLFERHQKRRQREIRGKLMSIMFMRFPLLDPDHFLERTLTFMKFIFSKAGFLIWLAVVIAGIKTAMDHSSRLWEEGQSVLAPGNLFLLYSGIIIIKVFHEFGHAYMCRKFGGEVHVMGVMLLIFTPIPYMDATSSWGFRNRWQRCLVGAAGMIVEIFIAALAVFVWANTGDGTVHSLAYNMMFTASVSTLLFNINPLMRFDGYYILSDLLDIPNLHQRARMQLRHIVEFYCFGYVKSFSPAKSTKEAFWLVVFGITSGIYRVVIFGSILLFLADQFLLAGILMTAICIVSWLIVPSIKLIQYMYASPRLERIRIRAVSVALGFGLGLMAFLQYIPLPSHFRAPGVVEAANRIEVVNETPGYLKKLLADPKKPVSEGQALVELEDPHLNWLIKEVQAEIAEVKARRQRAMDADPALLEPLQKRLNSVIKKMDRLKKREKDLIIHARMSGVWSAPRIEDRIGSWLPRGTSIGLVVDPTLFEFIATVGQDDGATLFADKEPEAEVRLRGQSSEVLSIENILIIPGEQTILPSAALGWRGGGGVAVELTDPEGITATEPFFEVRGQLLPTDTVTMVHGRSGMIRFDRDPEAILPRIMRKLRQVFQEHYSL